MLIWVIVALTAVMDTSVTLLLATAVVAVHPALGIGALSAIALARRYGRPVRDRHSEVSFLRELTAVVASGSTLRRALRDGDPALVSAVTRRLCDAGAPMARVGASMRDSLPTNGRAFTAVCDLSEVTGSSLAPTLFVLADRAKATEDLDRRRRIATTQARFSAAVVGVVPLVVTAGLTVVRRVPGDGGPLVVVPLVAGSALQLLGVAVVLGLAARYS